MIALLLSAAIAAQPLNATLPSAKVVELVEVLSACEESLGPKPWQSFRKDLVKNGADRHVVDELYRRSQNVVTSRYAPSERRRLFNRADCTARVNTLTDEIEDALWNAERQR